MVFRENSKENHLKFEIRKARPSDAKQVFV